MSVANKGASEVGNAFQKAIALVTASSELHLSPTTATGQQRVMPLGFVINVWLKKSMLSGAIFVAIATIVFVIAIPKGSLPTYVALWLDRQVAKGVVDNVQRRVVTKSKGMKETRWEIRYHFTPQNGQQLQGESYSSFSALEKGSQVDVEYYPKRPESNRIKGMAAKSDANSPAVLCLILMAVGLLAIAAELQVSLATSNLLKSGILGAAVVMYCKEITSGATWEFSGFLRKSPRQSNGKEILLADYQQKVLDQHKRLFDTKGKYMGTKLQRNVHVLIAAVYGAMFFSIFAFVLTAIFFGFPRGSVILGTACVGTAVGALVEMRWRLLLRSNAGNTKLDEVSSLFKKRACILQFQAVDRIELVRIEREVDLKGDASDSNPRPILYLQSNPTRAKLVDSLGFKSSLGPNGEPALTADSPAPQLIALFLIFIVVVIFVVVAIL